MRMNWFCDAHRAEHNECDHNNHGVHNHCEFGLFAPDRHTSINNLAFSAYAYHQTCIDDYVERLAAADDPNDSATQANLLYAVGLSPDALTSDDIEYIEREVSERYANRF